MQKVKKRIPKNYYNPDYIFLKKFLSITATKICNKYKFNRSGIMQGNGSSEQYKLIRAEIESEYGKLHIIDGKQQLPL